MLEKEENSNRVGEGCRYKTEKVMQGACVSMEKGEASVDVENWSIIGGIGWMGRR